MVGTRRPLGRSHNRGSSGQTPEIFFTIFVDGIFTTFIVRLFTNTSDAICANSATSCV
jgi:hypothetical protein